MVDRFWNLVMANNAAMLFLEGVPDELVRATRQRSGAS
ncbi:MAG: hypothetical protein ACJ72W_30200 [Actinoallomurus sp.]